MNEIFKCLKIIHLAQKLKIEKRHSWLENDEQESVAEHCWRLSLMVLLIAPHLKEPIDLPKALIMAVIHDLPETKVGDIPDFKVQSQDEIEHKFQLEKQAMDAIARELERPDLYDLWIEFEEKKTKEARFVAALDRIEGQIQHNEADISTWLDVEKKRQVVGYQSYCESEEALEKLADLVCQEAFEKLPNEDRQAIDSWMSNKPISECLKEIGIKGLEPAYAHEQLESDAP